MAFGRRPPRAAEQQEHTPEQLRQKMAQFCGYQERCLQEVLQKLQELGVRQEDEQQEYIAWLKEMYLLDQERFARGFVRGRFVYRQWGRQKIAYELRLRQVDANLIEDALYEEIDEQDYRDTLERMLQRKFQGSGDAYRRKAKAYQYAAGKGYEADLIWELLRNFS